MSSSSSYFRKFAQDNAGSPNFRRPEPKDESAKKANAIFKKYSSLGSTSQDATDNNKGTHYFNLDLFPQNRIIQH
jgi:hypothetical protein